MQPKGRTKCNKWRRGHFIKLHLRTHKLVPARRTKLLGPMNIIRRLWGVTNRLLATVDGERWYEHEYVLTWRMKTRADLLGRLSQVGWIQWGLGPHLWSMASDWKNRWIWPFISSHRPNEMTEIHTYTYIYILEPIQIYLQKNWAKIRIKLRNVNKYIY